MKRLKNVLVYIFIVTSFFICSTLAFYKFFCEKVVVVGTSMYPTLHEGELGVMIKKTFPIKFKRNDIIIFKKAESNVNVVKRIIGLPGEKIQIDVDGNVLINDQEIDQPYLQESEKINTYRSDYIQNMTLTLSNNEYYVMGDHRLVSLDSRIEGPIKEEYILAKLIFTYAQYNNFDSSTHQGDSQTYFPLRFF